MRVTGDRPLLHRDIGFTSRSGVVRRNNAPSPVTRIPERSCKRVTAGTGPCYVAKQCNMVPSTRYAREFLVLLLFICYVKAKKEERTMNEQKHKVMIPKRISKEAVSAESLRLLCQNLMVEVLK